MNILFVAPDEFGDAVMSTGLLAWLIEHYPDAGIVAAADARCASLFRAAPRLDRLIVLNQKSWKDYWFDFWQDCMATRWDLIVDLQNSLASRCLKAERRVTMAKAESGRHRVIDYADVLGITPTPAPQIWLDAAAEAEGKRLIQDDRPVLALGIATDWVCKQWPTGQFMDILQRLTAADGLLPRARPLFALTKKERRQYRNFLQLLPDADRIELIDADPAAVAACLKRCNLFIGNDSGLMHLAAAVGAPTLGLFGPVNETGRGPWGHNALAVRTIEGYEDLLERLRQSGDDKLNLMQSLSVDRVEKAARQLVKP